MGVNVAGTTISVSDGGSPEVFTPIATITDWSGPEISQGENDDTDISDVIATIKKNGVTDYGVLTLELNYEPQNTQVAALRTAAANDTQSTYRINYADSPQSTDTFGAKVTSFSSSGAKGGLLSASVSLNIQTAIT